MIFVDYFGAASRLGEVREVVTREVAAALRVKPEQVVVRRLARTMIATRSSSGSS